MKKFSRVLCFGLLTLSLSTQAFASPIKTRTVDGHVVTTIALEEIPEGVTPLVVNSREEADEAIRKFNEYVDELEANKQPIVIHASDIQPNKFSIQKSRGAGTYTQKFKQSTRVGFGGKLNLHSEITFGNYGSMKYIKSVDKTWVTHTGFTSGLSYSERLTSSKLSSDKNSANIFTKGEIVHYILINGIGEITRREFDYDYTIRAN